MTERTLNTTLSEDTHSKIIIGDGTNDVTIDENGLILSGTKEVYNILQVDLTAMKKGVGSPPDDGVEGGQATLDFDATTDEEVFCNFLGPKDWSSTSDATFKVGWFVDTAPAAAAGVTWALEYKSIEIGDAFDFTSGTNIVTSPSAVTTGTPANDKVIHCSDLTVPNAGLISGGILLVRISI